MGQCAEGQISDTTFLTVHWQHTSSNYVRNVS